MSALVHQYSQKGIDRKDVAGATFLNSILETRSSMNNYYEKHAYHIQDFIFKEAYKLDERTCQDKYSSLIT